MARLTPKGEDLYARLLNRTQHLQSLIQRMREDELTALLRGLQAMRRAVEEENEENCAAHTEFDSEGTIKLLKA